MRKIQPVERKPLRLNAAVNKRMRAIIISAGNSQRTIHQTFQPFVLLMPGVSILVSSVMQREKSSIGGLRSQPSLRNFTRVMSPLFEPPFAIEGAQFSLPNFPKQNNAEIGSAKMFVAAISDIPLANLRDVILCIHVGNRTLRGLPQILKTDLACENRFSQF